MGGCWSLAFLVGGSTFLFCIFSDAVLTFFLDSICEFSQIRDQMTYKASQMYFVDFIQKFYYIRLSFFLTFASPKMFDLTGNLILSLRIQFCKESKYQHCSILIIYYNMGQ